MRCRYTGTKNTLSPRLRLRICGRVGEPRFPGPEQITVESSVQRSQPDSQQVCADSRADHCKVVSLSQRCLHLDLHRSWPTGPVAGSATQSAKLNTCVYRSDQTVGRRVSYPEGLSAAHVSKEEHVWRLSYRFSLLVASVDPPEYHSFSDIF